MKEKEFLKELLRLDFENGKPILKINVCYSIDENGDVILDKEGIMEDLENELYIIENDLEVLE